MHGTLPAQNVLRTNGCEPSRLFCRMAAQWPLFDSGLIKMSSVFTYLEHQERLCFLTVLGLKSLKNGCELTRYAVHAFPSPSNFVLIVGLLITLMAQLITSFAQ
jgi:hypothetical protein